MKQLSHLFVPLLLSAITVSLPACKKDKTTPSNNTSTGSNLPVYPAREELNVAYGDHPLQKMDVYFPDNYNEQTPVVIMIHGGGFVAGVKEDFTTQAKLFRNEGFVAVNISHRLVDTTGLLQTPPVRMNSAIKVSDELNDVHASLAKYKGMAAQWHSGTGKIYMAGHSAGAILSMLYTYGEKNINVRACANWAGITDLSIPHDSVLTMQDPRYLELLHRASGAEPKTANNLAYMAISPYWVANKNSGKPTISIFPANNVVLNTPGEVEYNLHNTRNLHTLLKNKGIKEKLSIYANNDHGFSQPGSWEKLIKETAAFFKEQ